MENQEQILKELAEMLTKPGGKQAARFILNSLGVIPCVGSVIAASSNLWGEKDQENFNEKFLEWATQANANLAKVLTVFESQLKESTRVNFALLLGESLGLELPFIIQENTQIETSAILHPETLTEFKQYENTGWLEIISTGSIANMGAGNRIGNSIEDKKRPWGFGNGFILRINSEIYKE